MPGLRSIAFACLAFIAAPLLEAQTPRPTVKSILAQMARTYQTLRSYEDEGQVTSVFSRNSGGGFTTKKPFRTLFTRPKLFRFEYQDLPYGPHPEQRMVIWPQGNAFRTWWTVQPGNQEANSLEMALAGATGVSSGAAHTIPRLLIPSVVTGWSLTDLTRPCLVGEANVDGVRCYQIKGTDVMGSAQTVWIEKGTFLVRKIHEKMKLDEGTVVEETTVYRPKANPKIDPSRFRFTPPRGG